MGPTRCRVIHLVVVSSLLLALGACRLPRQSAMPAYSPMFPAEASKIVSSYAEDVLFAMGGGTAYATTSAVVPGVCVGSSPLPPGTADGADVESWWPGHSPYSESVDTFVRLNNYRELVAKMRRLRSYFEVKGWRVVDYVDGRMLRMTTPLDGYRIALEGIRMDGGVVRMGVDISSPCLRYPGVE